MKQQKKLRLTLTKVLMDESIFKADISILIMFIMLADKCLFKRWEEEISLKIFVLSEDSYKKNLSVKKVSPA